MDVELCLVPWDSGHRAVRMGRGPGRLVERGLPDRLRGLGHDVRVETVESGVGFPTEVAVAFDLARAVAERVRRARGTGRFPLVVAGNCMATVGAVAGLGSGPPVVWLDAHGDFNTPDTSGSGFLDGMAAATVVGWCWAGPAAAVPGFTPTPEASFLLVGARDLDPAEESALAASAVGRLEPEQARDPARFAAAVGSLSTSAGPVHLHVDLDVLDPEGVGRANRFAAPGGLTTAEVCTVVRVLREAREVGSATLSAYDPDADERGGVERAALEIAAALLGG